MRNAGHRPTALAQRRLADLLALMPDMLLFPKTALLVATVPAETLKGMQVPMAVANSQPPQLQQLQ